MAPSRRTVLITGCSEGGLGDALALAFHNKGHHVIATGRNPTKLAHFEKLGIDTLILDVLSPESISVCVASLSDKTGGSLDILINNSGGGYSMPLADADLDEARRVFDLNVWSVLAVTQAMLPLLRRGAQERGGAVVVNNTSVASVVSTPMSGIYTASKAAAAMITDNLRLELRPFGIRVVDLKTGSVQSNFFDNQRGGDKPRLPAGSMYGVARADVERILAGEHMKPGMSDRHEWARAVADGVLVAKWASVPRHIWKGSEARMVWFVTTFMPFWFADNMLWKLGGLDIVEKKLASAK